MQHVYGLTVADSCQSPSTALGRVSPVTYGQELVTISLSSGSTVPVTVQFAQDYDRKLWPDHHDISRTGNTTLTERTFLNGAFSYMREIYTQHNLRPLCGRQPVTDARYTKGQQFVLHRNDTL